MPTIIVKSRSLVGFVLVLALCPVAIANAQERYCGRPGCDTAQQTPINSVWSHSDLLAEAESQSESLCSCVSHHQSFFARHCHFQSFGCTQPGCYGEEPRSSFQLTEFNIYPTFSYLGDQSATYNEFEFTSHTTFGNIELENHTVLNVADLPSTISLGPTNPGELPPEVGVRASGFGDILSGFFFSRRDVHRNYELGIGPVVTFPSATDDILGSRQWTIGPGAHFSKEIGRLTAGFFLWQSWKVGGSSASKRTNQLFGKPFLIYELTEQWNLIFIPLGMSHSWEAKSGEDWTVPLGGGLRRLGYIGKQKMGLQAQAFDYVSRKPTDPEWELRFTIEFLFDE